jgi:hypothetical protein
LVVVTLITLTCHASGAFSIVRVTVGRSVKA